MHFTKFIQLTNKDKLDWELLGKYRLLVMAYLSPLLDQINEDIFEIFEGKANAYQDILFLFSKQREVNEKILRQFQLLGKEIENLDTGRPYFVTIKIEDILDNGHGFIEADITYLDEHLSDEPEDDMQNLSDADFALLHSFASLNHDLHHHKARSEKGKFVKFMKSVAELLTT